MIEIPPARPRSRIAGICLLSVAMASPAMRCPEPVVTHRITTTRGFVEPHTPGSGASAEFPITETVEAILGPAPDLNRVTTVRTRLHRPGAFPPAAEPVGPGRGWGARPRAILILVPGFLGGAATLVPVARQLVRELDGELEVWAVDRRPDQLEDRRGSFHAQEGVARAEAEGDPDAARERISEGVRFYFGDADLDGDGEPDGSFELPDALGTTSDFRRIEQDDMRFAAYWGVDTYARDWLRLVSEARRRVGRHGLVLFGGHSMGTAWAGAFAAYDFDPGAGVVAGHRLIDGMLLLEGGGLGTGSDTIVLQPGDRELPRPASAGEYAAVVDALAAGEADVYLADVFGVFDTPLLGAAAELAGLAGTSLPRDPSILQRTSVFGTFPATLLFGVPMTNRALVGFFIDDDFTTNPAFSASVGFSDNGPNQENPLRPFVEGDFYVASFASPERRTWKNFDEELPSCPPNQTTPGPGEVGCALRDNGPRPGPGQPISIWGWEREVTDVDELLGSLYRNGNFSEWYFVSGRVTLDFAYGRDSGGLGDESLLAITRNHAVDVPILCIGGSNGLTPVEQSFRSYLDSIATPPRDQEIAIIEGYAHLDPVLAEGNEAVPIIADWVRRLMGRKHPGRP